ncbi:MAG: bis(5'-nucleosyl)-tetraphosphatase (symmetrical) YqeK [Proteocatella sp.]
MSENNDIYCKVDETLKSLLTKKRYMHIKGVVDMSVELAYKYGENVEKCKLAAILHDYAKQFSYDEIETFVKSNNLIVDDLELASKELIHSKIAAKIAKDKYGIEDEDILNAISFHTTGRAGMSMLEKIIFIADSIEEGRKYPNVDSIRKIALIDIDHTMLCILNNTISYLLNSGLKIHPNSVIARNYFLDKNKEVNK